jgi:peptidoglycan/LPS O-acetylase OafA/YrhL
VRGVAVLVIVVHHSSALLTGSVDISRWLSGAFLGVDIFFVLSGFLITSLLVQEQAGAGRVRVLRFYGRRALRLLPALYFLLLVHVAYVWLTGLPRGPEGEAVLGAAFYYKNWLGVFQPDVALLAPSHGAVGLVHLWSLSLEMQFYLLWPLVVIAALTMSRKTSTAVATLVVLLVAVVVYRWILWDRAVLFFSLYPRTDTRADALIIGALLAVLWMRVELPRRYAAWFGLGAVVVMSAFIARIRLSDAFLWKGGLTIFAGAVAVALFAVLSGESLLTRALRWRPLVAVGVVSYGVYLWHLPIFDLVARYGDDWPVVGRLVVAGGLTAAFTWLSWRVIERPFLRRKQKLEAPGVESTGPSLDHPAARQPAGP